MPVCGNELGWVVKKKTPKRDIAVFEYGLRNCEVGKLIYYM
jgi:hypothetical protein